ncbi:uncharacterized protein with FMN-binding domain [Antricoccus suffuscus]|uniref:Uncharacterized protein with FMN-binding domain n=1 Tax=Antricoccus suffuscus TaxID=1629062 RepID=A0A2T0ZXI4_9ACTN|nr:FMN-binding protein [Antricoccus suffuscus]PRZ41060.1 uncharacterized protein with FMN-binding domain [Antricoccus suffuscus]
MRRIAFAIGTTLTLLFLLFSYRTSSLGPAAVTSSASQTAHVETTSPSQSAGAGAATPQASGGSAAGTSKKVDGKLVQTGYGPMVVQIVVTGNKITDVQAITYPTAGGRTESINSNALPILRTEVLKAQGTKIDGVSGATHTTDGYLSSLQSALDLAGLK